MSLGAKLLREQKMFCAHCGKDLREEQVCDLCGWSVCETNVSAGQPEQYQTGSGTAIASLVCGIVSWAMCGGGGIVPLIGLVLGISGLKSRQPEIAMVGIILNAVVLVLCVLLFLLFVTVWLTVPETTAVPGGRCC
jgi:hypothetical protein